MERDDIFRLLLIILLLTNNSGRDEENGLLWNINQIIIIVLLLSFNDQTRCTNGSDRREREGRRDRDERFGETDFNATTNPF